jgi:lipopolysaccharide transport system ATP-binding protein
MCSNQQLAIEAIGLSKCYRIYNKESDRIRDAIPWKKKQLYREFWALTNTSLTLKKGQTLGVIGRNGSGKSTLLQLICGTLTPTTGQLKVTGRIGALLELGSGFNPEFTGLENVRFNAAVLGLKEREINAKLDSILSFADIGDFIHQPVKHYSSGMVVRLAFAVQANIDPAILVVDEALAVGDELFQKKCFSRLEELKQMGTSILLVSHSCSQINQHCDEVLLLHKGKPQLTGDPHRVTAIYQRLAQSDDAEWKRVIAHEEMEQGSLSQGSKDTSSASTVTSISEPDKAYRKSGNAWLDPELKSNSSMVYPSNGVKITSIKAFTIDGNEINTIAHGSPFDIVVRVEPERDFEEIRIGCFIANQNGGRVTGQCEPKTRRGGIAARKDKNLIVKFKFIGGLWPGYYFIGSGVSEPNSSGVFLHRIIDSSVIHVLDIDFVQPIGNTDLSRGEDGEEKVS